MSVQDPRLPGLDLEVVDVDGGVALIAPQNTDAYIWSSAETLVCLERVI